MFCAWLMCYFWLFLFVIQSIALVFEQSNLTLEMVSCYDATRQSVAVSGRSDERIVQLFAVILHRTI